MSGVITLSRAQVLCGFRLEVARAAATFLASFSFTNGPFLRLRDIDLCLLFNPPLSSRNDKGIAPFFLFSRLHSHRFLSPWSFRRPSNQSGCAPRHHHAGDRPVHVLAFDARTNAAVTHSASFAISYQFVIGLPTFPTVARQSILMSRVSPDGRRSWAYSPSKT